MLGSFKTAGLLWPTILAVPALGLLLGLGTWQMQRKAWKEEVLATVALRAGAPPLTHAEALAASCAPAEQGLAGSCEYRRVRLRGRFDHSGERHIFAGAQGAGARAEVGYWVFTPFFPDAGAQHSWVYVNRGFVPERLKAHTSRLDGQIEGRIEVGAQIRTKERRTLFAGANDVVRNIFYVRDPAELAGAQVDSAGGPALIGNPAFYLELVEGVPPGGFPQPMAGRLELPNRHLEYALTWYGLALTLIGVYSAFAWTRLKAAQGKSSATVAPR